jgi:ATP-dependent protease ClpP protease subunit
MSHDKSATGTRSHQANRFWGSAPLPKAKTEFFNAVTTPSPSGDASVATIRMYGPIDSWGGFWGISTQDMGQVLDALPETVTRLILRINSPGGEVFEAVSILNMLRAHKASVTAVVDGLAASAASVIAAGADETVMSPGTQMMIHSPWNIVMGNAGDLRKQADVLDGLELSLVEIYTAKAGEKDWAALLAADTWMTAAETVEAGLADRVAVVPDAGEAETVGQDDDDVLVVIPDEDIDDAAASRVIRITARAAAVPLTRPAEPVSNTPTKTQKGVDPMADLKKELANRLGLSETAELTDAVLLSAVDEVLNEQVDPAAPTKATVPEGTVLIDKGVLDSLQADARLGVDARNEQVATRREGIVKAALEKGKIRADSREKWLGMLAKDEENTKDILDSLAEGTVVNLVEHGHTGGLDGATDNDAALYNSLFPNTDTKKEA